MNQPEIFRHTLEHPFQLDFTIHGGANDNSRAPLHKINVLKGQELENNSIIFYRPTSVIKLGKRSWT